MQPNNSSDPTEEAYRYLRRTAASDPREARGQLLRLLTTDGPRIDRLLDLMSSPADGRLRQLLANTLKTLRDKPLHDRLIPWLLRWQRFESDEFAKLAINAALQGLDLAAYTGTSDSTADSNHTESDRDLLFSEQHVETYRWVAGRLCHRVRNHLDLPAAHLSNAIHRAASIGDDVTRNLITSSLVEALQSLKKLARIVEFNIDDDHFIWRTTEIIPWLRRMNSSYRSIHAPMSLELIDHTKESRPSLIATDLLLEIIFLNIWKNAAEEVDGECVMAATISTKNNWVHLLLKDNGPGFRDAQASEAFHVSVSTRGEDRGRGLLEVADAVKRLQGIARIVPIDGEHRIELSFPLAPKEEA